MRNRIVALMGAKQAREERRISAVEVAAAAGISSQAMYKWINNEVVNFKSDTVEKLCRYFECEIGDLLYIDHSSN